MVMGSYNSSSMGDSRTPQGRDQLEQLNEMAQEERFKNLALFCRITNIEEFIIGPNES